VPALLATFQNEWDAIALETYELKKQLAQTRQELSTALYDYEGALRLLARVTLERDESRAALSRVQVGAPTAAGSDGMDVDGTELPESIQDIVDATQKKYVILTMSIRIANLAQIDGRTSKATSSKRLGYRPRCAVI
jgi:pre-mRNA-processing factor 19